MPASWILCKLTDTWATTHCNCFDWNTSNIRTKLTFSDWVSSFLMAHQHTKDHYITAPLNGTEIKNGKIMISKMQKSTLIQLPTYIQTLAYSTVVIKIYLHRAKMPQKFQRSVLGVIIPYRRNSPPYLSKHFLKYILHFSGFTFKFFTTQTTTELYLVRMNHQWVSSFLTAHQHN